MQSLLLRTFVLVFVALGIAVAHSWNTGVVLQLQTGEFDWGSLEEDDPATPVEPEKFEPPPGAGEGAAEGDAKPSETAEVPAEVPKVEQPTEPAEVRTTEKPAAKPEERALPAAGDPHITVEQAKRLFDRQFLPNGRQIIFIDARARSEFLKGHIENAISLPAGEFGAVLPAKATAWLPGSAVVIYCQGAECHDSHDVARRLQGANLDVTPIFILQAGYPAWAEAGHPTMTGPDVGWDL